MSNDKWGRRIAAYSFIFLVVSVFFVFVMPSQEAVSKSERRRLAKRPGLTAASLLDKTFMDDTEKYMLDRFPGRDALRRVKAYFAYDVLLQKENNDIYVADGHASKLEYPMNEASVRRLADKIIWLRQQYFPGQDFYYAVVPDKNYFLAEKSGFPSVDYGRMLELLAQELETGGGACYIDIISGLSIDDYYHTDTHWKQERLFAVADTITGAMGAGDQLPVDASAFRENRIPDFYGVYYGQAALPMEPDTIVWLSDSVTDAASVWSMEENMSKGNVVLPGEEGAVVRPVYRMDKLEDGKSLDKYDIFAGGASSLQVIKSPKAATDRRLIIFRDSYTSSLAPLLLGTYGEITLIDLRYIDSRLIGDYVDFADADILFLYNTLIVNQAEMLK